MGLYAGLVSLAVLAFFERAAHYMEIAERMAMEATVMNVNAALQLRSARAMLEGRSPEAPSVASQMAGSPNYAGALGTADLGGLDRAQWAFDSTRSELVYLPRLRRGLSVDDPDDAIRFRLGLDGKIYKLVPTNEYVWQ